MPAKAQTITADDTTLVAGAMSQIDVTITGSTLLELDTISPGITNGQRVMVRMVSVDTPFTSLQLNPGGNLSLKRDTPWCANSVDRWIEFVWNASSTTWVEVNRDYLSARPTIRTEAYVFDSDLIEIAAADAIADYSTSANGVLSLDEDNVYSSAQATQGSVRVTAQGTNIVLTLNHTFAGQPINVGAQGFVEIRMKAIDGEGTADPSTQLSYIDLVLYDNVSDVWKRRIWQTASYPAAGVDGWYVWRLPYSAFNTKVIDADDSGLTTTGLWKLSFEIVFTAATATCAFVLDRIAFLSASPLATGYYCVRIDDSSSDGLALATYAASKGVRCALCVNAKNIGGAGQLTRSDLLTIQRMGHEIGMYLGDYPNITWDVKTQYQKDGIVEFARWFCAEVGIPESSAVIAHIPGGSGWLPSDEDKIDSAYSMHTGAYQGATTNILNAPWNPANLHWTYFIDGAGASKDASFGSWITQCEAEKSIFLLGSHANDAAEVTTFKSCIDDLVASSLKPCTFSDILLGKLT